MPKGSDNRKLYPRGTRGAVTIEAETDEPQTKARGEEFARIFGEAMVEARAMVEERLWAAGFNELSVSIDMDGTDLGYWFDSTITSEAANA